MTDFESAGRVTLPQFSRRWGWVTDTQALFERLPLGWSTVRYRGRTYGVTISVLAGGRVRKVYAEELGGDDMISANLYLTAAGAAFRPCEMPAAKVTDFLAGLELG